MGDLTQKQIDKAKRELHEMRLRNEQSQQDMDDVDYRDVLMDDILTHIGKTGHTLTIVTAATGTSAQQTFILCTGCGGALSSVDGSALVEVQIGRSRYAREIQREIKS